MAKGRARTRKHRRANSAILSAISDGRDYTNVRRKHNRISGRTGQIQSKKLASRRPPPARIGGETGNENGGSE